MPEAASDKHIAAIPRFTLPPEFSNTTPAAAAPTPAPAAEATPPPTPAEAPVKTEPETPAATTAVATPPATPKETTDEPGKETTEKVPERLQKRIDRATRLRYEAEQRAADRERELAELRAKSTAVVADPNEPKMADYTDIAEYGKAMEKYGVDKAARQQAEKQRAESSQKFSQEITSKWAPQAAKGEVEFDDWEEVVGDLKPTAPWAVQIMQEENGYKIAHYLGKHPKEAERIIGLNPYAQVSEIVRLAVKLATPPPAPKKPSSAPAPITPVAASSTASDGELKPGMSYEDHVRAMNKRLGRGVK